MVSSTPPVFYFQLPAYPRAGSSLKRFGCCCLYLKLPDFFTILTFRPSSFCETSSFALTVGLRLVPGLIWHLLTSKGYHDVIPCSNICFHFDIRSYLCRIILRSLRVRLTAFHSCSLCIYPGSVLCSIRLLFVMQHHPHYPALYAVSVRRLECLPPASFRFHFAVDTLALG